jgi:hypothetical protein
MSISKYALAAIMGACGDAMELGALVAVLVEAVVLTVVVAARAILAGAMKPLAARTPLKRAGNARAGKRRDGTNFMKASNKINRTEGAQWH